MPVTQLDPPLPLETPRGSGLAHFVIDYGAEHDLMWVVFMDKDGACWTVPNPEIRMAWNWSMGRRKSGDHTRDLAEAKDAPRTSPAPVPLRPTA